MTYHQTVGSLYGSTATRTKNRPLVRLHESGSEDDEIERLKSMAAKLRSEAASLEAERAEALAVAAEKAFREFDTNQDGEISLSELKAGLEKILKVELSDSRVKQLMKDFDTSGDGALQLDEFVGVNQFRNRLEALAREEKEAAAAAKKAALLEKEQAALAEARLEFLNESEPTTTDKLVSILPYLFPLMDGLQYGRFLLSEAGPNPIVAIIAVIYALYRAIPFSGFVAFFALNFLSNNPSLNRLVRYNMQQAIFLDIALFFPGLVSGLLSLILGQAGNPIPKAVSELSTDAIFVTLLLALGYCAVSSLLGITPDKIPIVSQAVSDRMPTIDMFDDQGRFMPREMGGEEKDDKDKKDK
eukprot:CAMPEP_0185730122 /NCGR_PEP_ID=MMETSP1171-20130828/8646_1 /TAXON_ID=374046 /ORGANISM="Helicotheca tamensis, Strain CCMP826" /LENGTH=357 /DNA_ID=CAMNT_0028399113 /DNA_START=173 /DNA_END=1246 /DNA_ORIENTATION=+